MRPEPLRLDPKNPTHTAEQIVKASYLTKGGLPKLMFWQGTFFEWDGAAYRILPNDDIRAVLYAVLKRAVDHLTLTPFKPTRHRVHDILDALKAEVNLPARFNPPCWIDEEQHPPAGEIIACQNGLLHIPTRKLYPATPAFFSHNAVEFDYSPDEKKPDNWLKFLNQIFAGDEEAISTLAEIFGYCLTPDTSQQKIFMIVGVKRSGKGTIGRVLGALIGAQNVAGPTLSSLAQPFGLAPLIAKQLALVADARVSGRSDIQAIAERLLTISGEDTLSIPRKYNVDFTAKLSVRFLLLTNEAPRIVDASGALASRFIILKTQKSFFGAEDHGLESRLFKELPGILNWAIEGWQRLQDRGYFIQPQSAAECVEELADLGSPISAFVRDVCEVNPAIQIECSRLYAAWGEWCKEQGRDHVGTLQTFGRDLRAALPEVSVVRPRTESGRVRSYSGISIRSALVRDPNHCTRSEESLYRENNNGVDPGPSWTTPKNTTEVLI